MVVQAKKAGGDYEGICTGNSFNSQAVGIRILNLIKRGIMEVKIDEMELRKAGYINADHFNHVPLSFNLAAKILGISVSTVAIYARAGFIPTNDDDKISLADALKLDFEELHRKYIKTRNFTYKMKKSKR